MVGKSLDRLSAVTQSFTYDTVRSEGCILIVMKGFANEVLAAQIRQELLGHFGQDEPRCVLDLTGIDNFDKSMSEPFVDALKTFTDRGGGRIIIVAKKGSGVYMLVTSVAMSARPLGVPITIVENIGEAT